MARPASDTRTSETPTFTPPQTGAAFRDADACTETNRQDTEPYANERAPQAPSRRLGLKRSLDGYR